MQKGGVFMNDIMAKIRSGILDLFPEVGDLPLTEETTLSQIPDFDSMAAVNFQTYLEETFPMKVPLDMLDGETPLGELAAYILRYTGKKAAA
jgi:acyl carrier protein